MTDTGSTATPIPGPKPAPIVGNVRDIDTNAVVQSMMKLAQGYGPIFLQMGTLVANRELVNTDAPGARSKRHLEIALPDGMTYRTGDYLAVLPLNPPEQVDRALRRFGLTYDSQIVIRTSAGVQTFFPTDQPVTAGELLTSYVELGLPATRRQIEQVAISSPCPPEKQALEALIADDATHESAILQKRVNVLDLLE